MSKYFISVGNGETEKEARVDAGIDKYNINKLPINKISPNSIELDTNRTLDELPWGYLLNCNITLNKRNGVCALLISNIFDPFGKHIGGIITTYAGNANMKNIESSLINDLLDEIQYCDFGDEWTQIKSRKQYKISNNYQLSNNVGVGKLEKFKQNILEAEELQLPTFVSDNNFYLIPTQLISTNSKNTSIIAFCLVT